MRSSVATAVLLSMMTVPVNAQATMVYSLGDGQESCANWLSSPSNEVYGGTWILGFWTAGNAFGQTGQVGSSTDGAGIIASVKQLCLSDPALNLMLATYTVFNRFAKAGR